MLTLIRSTSPEPEVHLINIDPEKTSPKDWIINHLDCSRSWEYTSIGDSRYSEEFAFWGNPTKRNFIYFCDELIGVFQSPEAAYYAALSHKLETETTETESEQEGHFTRWTWDTAVHVHKGIQTKKENQK